MGLAGGAADKAGNRYADWWTALRVVELLRGLASRIRLEPPGRQGQGSSVNGARQDAMELYFEWNTSSGCALVTEIAKVKDVTRSMGAGLTPAPERVAGFFLAGLAERLAPFDRKGPFRDRFHHARNAAAERLAVDAVLSEDTVVSIPVRAGELAAHQRLVQFVDMSEALSGVAVQLELVAAGGPR
ncbi:MULTISPECIES: hypothetical protein [Streptomyces]|uniref:Uncharacterized protein n=1 Tax=Streptomyces caniscabiei TaxID=2746961 RepID=A0ABU4N321_9ACTN|nr:MULTISPECIES: hypothetical protein [Streptomyces]MBE4733310.1 hypothetical protein [Streptomyces caniscabiei]MBE4754488.1 hypothetical protein [Streptomyces caniscabiei]MBE4768691.1 hypothetical protein [Streptomyces caniscabiei]MBE4781805.1 hypothetical protein [Streptomyces caniscabiei]MBE4793095.1 hypothetical protein [Streptomyces caniscabiei]